MNQSVIEGGDNFNDILKYVHCILFPLSKVSLYCLVFESFFLVILDEWQTKRHREGIQ